MEAFTLLRYWRTVAGNARTTTRDPTFTARASSTRYSHHGDDEGPFFDLEFSFTYDDGHARTTLKDTEPENEYSDEELSESGNGDEKLQFALSDCEIGADDKFTEKSLKTEADDGLSDEHFTVKLRDSDASSEESILAKELVQKYFKMLKPLCNIRVSSRYLEKMKLSWEVAEAVLPGNLKGKHLGKSRSTSAAVVVPPAGQMAANNRRCDSVVEMHDGIEGAILHCKRSFFNASRDGESCVLTRSSSDQSYDKSEIMAADSWASTALQLGDVIEIKVN